MRVGQTAALRFSAFSQRTTPGINGTVSRVSADVTMEQRAGTTYYTARIAIGPEELGRLGDAMQRYLANDKATIRTLSQWQARQSEKPLPSYNPLVLARLLMSKKKFEDGLRKAGLPE